MSFVIWVTNACDECIEFERFGMPLLPVSPRAFEPWQFAQSTGLLCISEGVCGCR